MRITGKTSWNSCTLALKDATRTNLRWLCKEKNGHSYIELHVCKMTSMVFSFPLLIFLS